MVATASRITVAHRKGFTEIGYCSQMEREAIASNRSIFTALFLSCRTDSTLILPLCEITPQFIADLSRSYYIPSHIHFHISAW